MRIENNSDQPNITFSWKERLIILTKGKLIFSPTNFKHFCNALFSILVEFQKKIDPKLQKLNTNLNDDIKTQRK